MSYVKIENLLKKIQSLYKLVTVAYKRVLELSEGAQKLVDTDNEDIFDIALKEIEEGKVYIDENNKKEKKDK